MKQAIPPMYECRDDRAIFVELARRLGINNYDDKTEEQWLRYLTKDAVDDFEAFQQAGVAQPYQRIHSVNTLSAADMRSPVSAHDHRLSA
jgi:anaerobic selenocysteine-containing dehydrogenase